MKHFSLFIAGLGLYLLGHAEVPKTIEVTTAGTFSSLLTAEEKASVTNLTVTGNIDARDFKSIRDEIQNLSILDLSQVSIKKYEGSEGTYPTVGSSFIYPDNELPAYSFYDDENEKDALKHVTLPENCTKIGNNAFGYTGITVTDIPESVTKIGISAYISSGLTSLVVPNSVNQILNSAFRDCSSLGTVTLGKSVTTLDDYAFEKCTSLKKLYSLNETPPTLGDHVFDYTPSLNIVYVPEASVDAYKASAWGSIFTIKAISTLFELHVGYGTNGILKDGFKTVPDGASYSISKGDTKTFTIAPSKGYEVSSVTFNGVDMSLQLVGNQFTTPEITKNSTLEVTFRRIEYEITVTYNTGGKVKEGSTTITPGSVVKLYPEETKTFTIEPSDGYKVSVISYKDPYVEKKKSGEDVLEAMGSNQYTTPTVNGDGTLEITFYNTSSTSVPTVSENNIKVYGNSSDIVVEGLPINERVEVYSMKGTLIYSATSNSDRLFFPVRKGAVYLIRTPTKTFKVAF
jgi:hypothetical protein